MKSSDISKALTRHGHDRRVRESAFASNRPKRGLKSKLRVLLYTQCALVLLQFSFASMSGKPLATPYHDQKMHEHIAGKKIPLSDLRMLN
jgi:hypothetical protein